MLELYNDPAGVGGDGNPAAFTWTPGAVAAGAEQGPFPTTNNGWNGVTFTHQPDALNPVSGNYQYALVIKPANPTVDLGWNAFKIRAFGTVILLGNQMVAFLGALNFPEDLPVIYPNYPALDNTPYDGTWSFKFRLPPFLGDVTIYDGDMDYGDLECDYRDTDDNDSSGIPPFASGTPAVAEGVATIPPGFDSFKCGPTGLPADDSLSPVFEREPTIVGAGIAYRLVAPASPNYPGGQTFLNSNPSGNIEWEQFKIQLVDTADITDGPCPVGGYPADIPKGYEASDCRTDELPGGVWDIQLDGMDLANLNFWFFSFKVEPIETEYSIGRLVWYDTNENGVQDLADPTEIGIPGVTYTVYDGPLPGGAVVRAGATDANGEFREEGLPAGNYTVVVDAANLGPGGPLEGWFSTTGGEVVDGVEVGLEVCVDTNVPEGCGLPLYAEAIFGYVEKSDLECIINPKGGPPQVGAVHSWSTNPDGSITLRTTLSK